MATRHGASPGWAAMRERVPASPRERGVQPRESVTIRDVARAAEVSVSTVSHVLSGNRPTSSVARQRVLAAIEQLGYRPNEMARSLVLGRSFALGLVIPDISNPYYPALALGAEHRVRSAGYSLVLGNTQYDRQHETGYLELLRTRHLGGLIYCPGGDLSPVLAELRRAVTDGLALVLVHSPTPGIPTVCADNQQGGRLAAEHLLRLGHTRLGVVSALPLDEALADREGGFMRALAERGLPTDRSSVPVEYGDHQIGGGREAMAALLSAEPRVTAVFVLNDMMALGALEAARAAGRRVPDDLSVVGFDGIPFSALANPPLTTVAQPIRQLGERAAELLLRLAPAGPPGNADETPSVVLPNTLVPRASSGPASAGTIPGQR